MTFARCRPAAAGKNSEKVDGNRMYNNLVGLKISFVPAFLSGAGRRRRAPDEPDGQGGGPRHCAVRALQQLCQSGARLALVQAPPRPGGPRRGAGPVRLLHEVQGGQGVLFRLSDEKR